MACERIFISSSFVALPDGVLMMSVTLPSLIKSTILGLPSCNFGSIWISMSFDFKASAVPDVAMILNPRSANFFATNMMLRLSWFFTLIKTLPFVGSFWPAARWLGGRVWAGPVLRLYAVARVVVMGWVLAGHLTGALVQQPLAPLVMAGALAAGLWWAARAMPRREETA